MSTTFDWSSEFPILNEIAFFNHAGVSPIPQRSAQAMIDYARHSATRAYVGSGWYKRCIDVKQQAARLIGAASLKEIAFVPNTSTGLALVAKGIPWQPGDSVVVPDVEFPANRYPWEDLQRFGVELLEVRAQPDGRIDVEDVVDAINDRTRIVAISAVQYASGFRIDLRPISDMVHKAGGYLCVDAIQAVGALPVNVQESGIDFLSADGHKWMLGPEGSGIFYCKEDLIEYLHPNVVGWLNVTNRENFDSYHFNLESDARRFEPGCYNIPGILGLGASLDLILEVGITEIWSRIESLTDRLCAGLTAKGYRVFSPRDSGEKSGIVVFEPPAVSPVEPPTPQPVPALQKLADDLEKQGIVIVVRAGRFRASPHFYNTPAQIDRLLHALP